MFKEFFIHIRKKLFLTVGFGIMSAAMNVQASELSAGASVPPPIGYMRFCLLNPGECQTAPDAVQSVSLNSWRWAELQAVQTLVNRQVQPRRDGGGFSKTADNWEYPRSGYGDCEDYALAKRQALIRRGWSSKALRLVTAKTQEGEPHVVLAVSTSNGDFILDNLNSGVQRWESVNYQWLSVQDRDNPLRWRAARPIETAVASLGDAATAH